MAACKLSIAMIIGKSSQVITINLSWPLRVSILKKRPHALTLQSSSSRHQWIYSLTNIRNFFPLTKRTNFFHFFIHY